MPSWHVVVQPKYTKQYGADNYDDIKARFHKANEVIMANYPRFTDPPSRIGIRAHLEVGSNRIGVHMDAVFEASQKCKLRLDNLRQVYRYMLFSNTEYSHAINDKTHLHLHVKFIPDLVKWVNQYSAKEGVEI